LAATVRQRLLHALPLGLVRRRLLAGVRRARFVPAALGLGVIVSCLADLVRAAGRLSLACLRLARRLPATRLRLASGRLARLITPVLRLAIPVLLAFECG